MRRIAVCGLVLAALVAAGAAGAQEESAEEDSRACPDAPAASGFSDVADLGEESQAAIACIVHFGVTKGATADTFAPAASVTRAQMARFLIRTARALGVELPENPVSPFTDIAHLGGDTRTDIALLHQLEITRGAADDLFNPGRAVPRGQMALFIHRLALKAKIAFPETPAAFADLTDPEAELTRAAGALAAAGIMPGAAEDEFRPAAVVTREDMALFLSRALAAGDASPVLLGIVIEPDRLSVVGSATVTITARKPSGDPYPGLLVDVFAVERLYGDGLCRLDAEAKINGIDPGTSLDCQIDRADPRTDSSGKAVVGLSHSPTPTINTLYVWTGEEGEVFNANRVNNEASAPVVWRAAPSELEVSAPAGAKYDKEVRVTARLRGSTLSRQRIVLQVIRDGLAVFTREDVVSGIQTAAFTYTGPSKPVNIVRNIIDTIRVFWDRNGNGLHDGPAELSHERPLVWS